MVRKPAFTLVYAPLFKEHLRVIEPKYYSLIRNAVESQLQFEPDVETRNRKQLKRRVAFGARWEVRFGPENRFRVFYRVNPFLREVYLLAIGEKIGARLLIGGEEVKL
jgi:mRNA-degrading endonuclease RelE of RelBE toxin-antitoxin system